jgi:hypothetical protein
MAEQLVRENITRDSLYDRDQYLWRLEAIAHLQAGYLRSKHNLYNLQNF